MAITIPWAAHPRTSSRSSSMSASQSNGGMRCRRARPPTGSSDRPDPRRGGPNDMEPDESTDPDHELVGDEKMFTGEPVETDEGVRRPQQMPVGKDIVEGGGE